MYRPYHPIKEGTRYTIGHYDASYDAYIINDGICGYYHWESHRDAQAAADALNAREDNAGLDNHEYGHDRIAAVQSHAEGNSLVKLYGLFGAVDWYTVDDAAVRLVNVNDPDDTLSLDNPDVFCGE